MGPLTNEQARMAFDKGSIDQVTYQRILDANAAVGPDVFELAESRKQSIQNNLPKVQDAYRNALGERQADLQEEVVTGDISPFGSSQLSKINEEIDIRDNDGGTDVANLEDPNANRNQTPLGDVVGVPPIIPPIAGYGGGSRTMKATENYYDLLKSQQDEEAAAFANAQKVREEQIRQMEVADEERQKQLDNGQKDYQEAVGAFQSAKIDPQRLYSNSSTGQKVLGAIGLIFGALGTSAGGENKAATIIRNAIDQDLNTQKAEIAKLGNVATAKSNLYRDMRLRFNDDRLAEKAAMNVKLQSAIDQIKAIQGKYAGRLTEQQGEIAIGQLEAQQAQNYQEFLERYRAMMPVTPGTNPEALSEDKRKRYVNTGGYFGLTRREDQAKKFEEDAIRHKSSKRMLQQLLDISEKGLSPRFVPTDDDRAIAQSISTMLTGEMRTDLVGPGAITEAEWALLKKVIPDPSAIFQLGSQTRAKLKAIMGKIDNRLADQAKAYGLKSLTNPYEIPERERKIK